MGGKHEKNDLILLERAIACLKDLEPKDDDGPHLDKNKKPLIGILWLIYGYENKLKHEEFMDKLATPECSWILDPAKIRIKIKPFMNDELLT